MSEKETLKYLLAIKLKEMKDVAIEVFGEDKIDTGSKHPNWLMPVLAALMVSSDNVQDLHYALEVFGDRPDLWKKLNRQLLL